MTKIDIIVEAAYASAGAAQHVASALYLAAVITADISETVASYLSFSFIFSTLFLVYCRWVLFSTEALCTFDSTWHDFFSLLFHAPLSVFRFSFLIRRISIFRSDSCQVQWIWLLIRKLNQTVVPSYVDQSFLPVDQSLSTIKKEDAPHARNNAVL